MMSRKPAEHRLIVDRFEGEFAAVELEGGSVIDLPRWMLPAGARPGDVLQVEKRGGDEAASVCLRIDPLATSQRRAVAEARLTRLRRRDPGGDLLD